MHFDNKIRASVTWSAGGAAAAAAAWRGDASRSRGDRSSTRRDHRPRAPQTNTPVAPLQTKTIQPPPLIWTLE
ncbi:hypothetical protein JYU34_001720 [Plutella xylostella]|uniref:Secreted protein n=1 Tax=Plutella xylostella TaxID=51655 RepID=A0ABQ7R4M8_PLUXY|nr:hypothetical protein JYU34_001720 [Plutella xylostella]